MTSRVRAAQQCLVLFISAINAVSFGAPTTVPGAPTPGAIFPVTNTTGVLVPPEKSTLACSGLHIQDVAFAVITGSEEDARAHAALRTWLSLAPYAYVFVTRDGQLSGADHVQALSKLYSKFPSAKWYVVSDEDTVIYLYNLLCLLATKNAEEPHFIGTHHCQGPNFQCQKTGILDSFGGWVNGGAGMVLSGGLVRQIDHSTCVQHYSTNWGYQPPAADVALSCCVSDYFDGGITHHMGFFREGPGNPECECGSFCTYGVGEEGTPQDVISHHHLNEQQIEELFKDHREANAAIYAGSDVYCVQDNGDPTKCAGISRVSPLWDDWDRRRLRLT